MLCVVVFQLFLYEEGRRKKKNKNVWMEKRMERVETC
jgi:hypothetical protein